MNEETKNPEKFMKFHKLLICLVLAGVMIAYGLSRVILTCTRIELWRSLRKDPYKDNQKQDFAFRIVLFLFEVGFLVTCIIIWYSADQTKK